MRVLVTGAGGQLGSAVCARLERGAKTAVVATRRGELDLADQTGTRTAIARHRPDWIVNCAAFTAVDLAETESEAAYAINDVALGAVAEAALDVGARVLHVSTDYVFSGAIESPNTYDESAPVGPLSVYGASKYAGEVRLLGAMPGALVLRTSWVYGGPEKNFLRAMLRLGESRRGGGEPLTVVDDQVGTPTDCFSLAEQIARLLEPDADELRGVIHASSAGETTWCRFAREIFRRVGWDVRVDPIRTEDWNAKNPGIARRPVRGVLENARLRVAGLDVMPDWEDGLARVLEKS